MSFKWSHFKKRVLDKVLKSAISGTKIDENIKNKVLIVTVDALGDNLVKATTIKKIAEYYGKENIYILCKDKWAKIYEIQGYNVFIDRYKNILERIKLYKKINEIPYEKVIYFNHSRENEVEDFILCKNKIENKDDFKYVLEQHVNILKKVTGKDYTLEDVRPDLKNEFLDAEINNTISIGIGASNQKRTVPVKKMREIIVHLRNRFPNKKIILLGSGKKQVEYTKELMKGLEKKNIEDLVEKVSLIETLKIVANSDLFIGYDSGLTNAAFSFNTKYICLHWSHLETWWHRFNNCVTIIGDEKNPVIDGIHGTKILNSITLDQIDEGIEELNIT